ncbi:MAG: universal stress protein [Polyangiaceae bacterium]|nr:universal stress protein [Polyangiaceae bacterium]
MTLPKTILVPTDFGEGSEAALLYAVDLAKVVGADLVVLHAFEIPMVGFPDGTLAASAEFASRVLEGARAGLDNAIKPHEASGVSIRGLIKQGDTWRTILDAVAEVRAGLIVMGTHGRRGLPRALLGSVAEKIVRTAPCPVLTVQSSAPPS